MEMKFKYVDYPIRLGKNKMIWQVKTEKGVNVDVSIPNERFEAIKDHKHKIMDYIKKNLPDDVELDEGFTFTKFYENLIDMGDFD